ncbi:MULTISPECIES: hypothetical protein [Paraburkholderia]|jgi:hypothetical protein|uniref:Uncharacterized protein n=1 Tax=Paraburkholderia graminis TaxID=60548 RepID=A0ABD5CNZ4_9BURK|nr:hypothetical protein [Paraburkholderia graminis]MDQ0622847.1 hypothetical protein [Paraburkholderia graminis]MDR6206950.1 hypothetical protein [Paraburkholderia graminis]
MPFLAIVFAAGTCRLCGGWRRVVFNAGFEAGLEAGLEAAFEAVCRAPLEAVLKAISEAVFDAVPKSVELHSKQARRLPLNGAVRAAGELVRM